MEWEKTYMTISRKLLADIANENETENTVCSPYSFFLLLALVLNATRGKTQNEIKELIASGYSVDEFNEILRKVQTNFTKQKKLGKLVSSNGICIEDGLYMNILDDFKRIVSTMYDAEIFKGGTDMVKQINSWVCEKTDGMIPELMEQSSDKFKMCLMNAVAFDAKWQEIYDEDDIYEECEFNNADGTVSSVTLMRSTENVYIEDDYFTGFIRDYKYGKYAFMALLPKNNNREFMLYGIEQIDFSKYYKEHQDCEVCVMLPEFECEINKNLTELCKRLGLESIFTNEADFSGIAEAEDIQVDSIIQKAKIKVNRSGTKAAVVTSMEGYAGCASEFDINKKVILDRPFVYAVINKEYGGLPVFTGVVNKM